MPSPKVSLLGAWAAAALAFPASAAAIDPGVNYDPGSPAGKEYAIPLVEGRSDAAGTADPHKGANIPFGVGIKPPGGGGGGGGKPGKGGRRDAAANRSGSQEGHNGQLPGARRGESAEELSARIARAEAPGGTAARTLLFALAVLGPAGFLALLLWQRGQVSRTGRTA
jgi:hypothetical protein